LRSFVFNGFYILNHYYILIAGRDEENNNFILQARLFGFVDSYDGRLFILPE
jgi:hypothetical protein